MILFFGDDLRTRFARRFSLGAVIVSVCKLYTWVLELGHYERLKNRSFACSESYQRVLQKLFTMSTYLRAFLFRKLIKGKGPDLLGLY